MDLRQLRYFIALNEHRSFVRAADAMGITQPAFSRSIQGLEQEFGCVLNYLSLTERLPTVFMPVSPAPYLNGGPADFLSWVIETKTPELKPETVADWLEGRLPRPVDDPQQWEI